MTKPTIDNGYIHRRGVAYHASDIKKAKKQAKPSIAAAKKTAGEDLRAASAAAKIASEYDVVGGIDARKDPAQIMTARYEKPQAPAAGGYHPKPGARPTIYVPREMTEAEHKKHLADQPDLESDPKHAANIARIRLYEAEQAKLKAANDASDASAHEARSRGAPTSAAFTWSHAQVLCEKPLRKVMVEKLDDGNLHVVMINTTPTTQHHTHFKLSLAAAQSLHDLFELAGCTPVKTPMALEMTFEVPQEPARGVDA